MSHVIARAGKAKSRLKSHFSKFMQWSRTFDEHLAVSYLLRLIALLGLISLL